MSIEEEIQRVEHTVTDVELYVQAGLWNPDRSFQLAGEIVEADMSLTQLMFGHSENIDILSPEQVALVSDSRKRLSQSKDKLPSPPWS